MAEYEKIDNPTLDVNLFTRGDFVHWLMMDNLPSFAVVGRIDNEDLIVMHFEDGFPFVTRRTPKYGSVRKATRDEALAHFHKISENYGKEIGMGGLPGALASRRQHYLDGIISQLETEGIDTFDAVAKRPKEPMTGTYVLMGIYSGQGPSEHLDSIVATPRISEEEVSERMISLHPNGFGRIPGEVHNTPATSHGSLVAYWAYEVPEKALVHVVNPKRLEL